MPRPWRASPCSSFPHKSFGRRRAPTPPRPKLRPPAEPPFGPASKAVFQRKLDHARIHNRRRDLPESRRRIQRCGRIAKLWMVEKVEKFRAELERLALGKECVLDQRDVPVELSGSQNDPWPGIAEQSRVGARERRR